jgi:Lrp/AsnC family leucine-responsive transcriptional regulator
MASRANIDQRLDFRDRHILDLVQRDAKMPQAEIARRVGLSTASVNERLRKLENAGVIQRYVAQVDAATLGATITAFIEVFIEHPRHEPAFLEQVMRLDEILECHHITGEFSLLLKVRVQDVGALQKILLRQLNSMEGIRQTRTVMVLSTAKEHTFIPTIIEGTPR